MKAWRKVLGAKQDDRAPEVILEACRQAGRPLPNTNAMLLYLVPVKSTSRRARKQAYAGWFTLSEDPTTQHGIRWTENNSWEIHWCHPGTVQMTASSANTASAGAA